MSKNPDAEAEWLRSVILPKLVEAGKLVECAELPPNADVFKVKDIAISFIGAEEAFMLTSCYRATVQFEYAGVAGTRSLVVKKTPELPEFLYDAINFKALFTNEIESYVKILPEIEQFAGISLNVPKYYYSDLQRAFATVILGDFTAEGGWYMTKNKANLTLEHIMLGVQYLAKFHGIGFALKQVKRSTFDSITSTLEEARFASAELPPEYELALEASKERIHVATEKYEPQVAKSFVKQLTDLTNDYIGYGKQRVAPREPLVTLCHGDYLRNNIAFKYDNANLLDAPHAVIMFDLQTMRLSSPMMDLTIFLALSTFAAVRYTHFAEIFGAYCSELRATYERLTKQTAPQYLSDEALLQEYILFLPYSISITASFLQNLVQPLENSIDEMILQQRSPEEIREDAMTRGGEVVDRELAHQVKELQELSVKHDVDICDGINY